MTGIGAHAPLPIGDIQRHATTKESRMRDPGIVGLADRQQWLDPTADAIRSALQKVVGATGPAGRHISNALYGVWLKHPLHPALSDVPVGAWTVALVLDAFSAGDEPPPSTLLERVRSSGQNSLARGADAAVAVGVVAAVGAAASGAADWQHEYERTARIGLAHGLLNAGATALYATSLVFRSRGKRRTAFTLSLVGYALVSTAGYLGGELVFGERLGVDHTAGLEPPAEFTPVLDDAELPEGSPRRVRVKNVPVLLVRQGGELFALVERCSHRGGPLSEGALEEGCIVCPWHGSRFALADGRVIDGPASFPQPRLETRVLDGKIQVRLAQDA